MTSTEQITTSIYGQGDSSFRAAGMQTGIRKLVNDFYEIMDQHPEANKIRRMHPAELEKSRDKLALFLCGWLGGPRLYQEKYGVISIPKAHFHLNIGSGERDAWLLCMAEALKRQPYAPDFKIYLLEQLIR